MIAKVSTSDFHDFSEFEKDKLASDIWKRVKTHEKNITNIFNIKYDNTFMRNNALHLISKVNPFEAGTDEHEQFKWNILSKLENHANVEYASTEKNGFYTPAERAEFAQKSYEKAIEKNREARNARLDDQNLRFLLGIYPHFKALEAAYKAVNEASTNSTFKVALFTHA